MKILILSLCLYCLDSFAFTVATRLQKPDRISTAKRIVSSYKSKDFESVLRRFTQSSSPSRFIGTSGHTGARSFIIDHIKKGQGKGELLFVDDFKPAVDLAIKRLQRDFKEKIEGQISKDDQVYGMWQRYTNSMVKTLRKNENQVGKNIIWEKKGAVTPQKVLLLGANYDTIVIDKKKLVVDTTAEMPGADNNASGVSVALSMIEILQELELPITVRVVFFDFEELGMLGSQAYIKKYLSGLDRNEQIIGFLNLRMLGHDTKISDKTKRKGNMSLYIRTKADDASGLDEMLAKRLVATGSKISGVKFKIDRNSYRQSSHANFWDAGIPAMLFTHDMEHDSNELRNHTSNDFIETLNLRTLFNSFKYISTGVIGEAFGISR